MKVFFIILAIIILLVALFFARSEWERVHPVLRTYEVKSAKLPQGFDGMKIVFLADFHNQDYGTQKENLYQMIRDAEPDLILMGGDMLYDKYEKVGISEFEELLKHLPVGVPCYFAKGNHEERLFKNSKFVTQKKEFLALLETYHVTLLSMNSAEITREEESIVISALDLPNAYYKNGPKKELEEGLLATNLKKTEKYHICLCHSPLYREELADAGVDLSLSGHFHGGTIYLGEKLGGLMTPQFQLFSKDCKGMKVFGEQGEKAGIVSAGIGTHTINIRLNDRPEII